MHSLLMAVLIAFTLAVASPAGQSSPSIVGTWKIVKYEDRAVDGTLSYPYGTNPVGYFVYDATGHLSVHIMRTPALKSFPGMRDGTATPPPTARRFSPTSPISAPTLWMPRREQ